jgi:hypothetical protein
MGLSFIIRSLPLLLLFPVSVLAQYANPVVSDAENNTGAGAVVFGGRDPSLSSGGPAGNTGVGAYVMQLIGPNPIASNNTGVGAGALSLLFSGGYNTAVGAGALSGTPEPAYNSADVGNNNTAIGAFAMGGDQVDSTTTVGIGAPQTTYYLPANNVAVGDYALYNISGGTQNTALGHYAMSHNSTGELNVAIGATALKNNIKGSNNIAIGSAAGYLTNGSNNIVIGNEGVVSDEGIIRIGTPGTHAKVYLIGVDVLTALNAQAAEIATLKAQVAALQKLVK